MGLDRRSTARLFINWEHNWVQAVLLGLKAQGLAIVEGLVRAATSFGGGVALSNNMCGFLGAAATAVGLVHGSTDPTARRPVRPTQDQSGQGLVP